MFLSDKLITTFFTNWSSELAAADCYNKYLNLSEESTAYLDELALSYIRYQPNEISADMCKYSRNYYYYTKVCDLLSIKQLVQFMDMNNSDCYFAAVNHTSFIFCRNKRAFVDSMRKMLYTYGWLPVYRDLIKVPGKKVYTAFYFTNIVGIIPTTN